jgi:hypothetical protein
MSLVTTLKHLEEARKIVDDGERDLVAQRRLVEKLEQKGRDDFKESILLEHLEKMQERYVAHRDRLEKRLMDTLRPVE